MLKMRKSFGKTDKKTFWYPVFRGNCNQQGKYCVKTIHISKFGFVPSESVLVADIPCKISAPVTPLTKLGELGSEIVHICVFKVQNRSPG